MPVVKALDSTIFLLVDMQGDLGGLRQTREGQLRDQHRALPAVVECTTENGWERTDAV